MLADDILKIKIIRDIEKINQPVNHSLWALSQVNKIKASFNSRYLNLLELVKNEFFRKAVIPTRKITITDLNNMNIDFFCELSYPNVRVTNSPYFQHFYVENNNLLTKSCIVVELRNLDTKEYIRKHPYDLFFIYQIDRNNARWKQFKDDKGLMRYDRKLKLEHLKELAI